MIEAAISHIRRNVVGYVAIVMSLGATSYAATQLPRASVGTKQLRKGAVTNAKIRAGSLVADRFAKGVLPGDLRLVVRTFPIPGASSGPVGRTARCEPGERAVGGGYRYQGQSSPEEISRMRVLSDAPSVIDDEPVGWGVVVQEETGGSTSATPTVYAICVKTSATP